MIEKDFAKVAELYSTAVPTFTSFSVFSFNDLVKYAVITGIMYLPRPVLKSRLVSQSDVEIALMEMRLFNHYFCPLMNVDIMISLLACSSWKEF